MFISTNWDVMSIPIPSLISENTENREGASAVLIRVKAMYMPIKNSTAKMIDIWILLFLKVIISSFSTSSVQRMWAEPQEQHILQGLK